MGRHLTAEDLERAAYERFANKQTWAEIGNLLGCTEKTLWSHRHTPAWEGAKREAIAALRCCSCSWEEVSVAEDAVLFTFDQPHDLYGR